MPDVEALAARLKAVDYLADEGLATAMFLALRLPQPLLLEGEAGVGKTEAAKALAAVLDTPLIRLQCYEGIDAAEALYEWNYPRQLLRIRLAEAARRRRSPRTDLFGAEYLIARPLLQAIEHPGPRPAVLLIDELDRADDDFEAFLFELLAESSGDDPRAGDDPRDAPARRGAHLQPHPRPPRRAQAPLPLPLDRLPRPGARGRDRPPPGAGGRAAARRRGRRRACGACAASDVQKPPGIAEAIDWVAALELLGVERLDAGRRRAHARLGAQVPRGPGPRARAAASTALVQARDALRRSTCPPSWPRFGRRAARRRASPCTPERSARFARGAGRSRARPRATRLYWTARAVLVSSREEVAAFDARVRARSSTGCADPADARGDPGAPRRRRAAGPAARADPGRRAAEAPGPARRARRSPAAGPATTTTAGDRARRCWRRPARRSAWRTRASPR